MGLQIKKGTLPEVGPMLGTELRAVIPGVVKGNTCIYEALQSLRATSVWRKLIQVGVSRF